MGPCEPIFNTAGEVIAVNYFDLPVQRNVWRGGLGVITREQLPGELRQNVGDLNYDNDDRRIVYNTIPRGGH